jgi:hypothetical protein
MKGLTQRVKEISKNTLLCRRIYDRLFPNIRKTFKVSKRTLPQIQEIHKIYPQYSGTFIDFLARYLCYSYIKKEFKDFHCEKLLNFRSYQSIHEKIRELYITLMFEKNLCEKEIIHIIAVISVSHFMNDENFNREKYQKAFDYINSMNDKEYKEIFFYIDKFIDYSNEMLISPLWRFGNIKAIPDLVSGNTLIDFKVMKNSCDCDYNILQLLGYSGIALVNNIKKVTLSKNCNFYTGEVMSIDISNVPLEKFLKFLDIISNGKINL